jgi:cytochrome c oxidase subunit 2
MIASQATKFFSPILAQGGGGGGFNDTLIRLIFGRQGSSPNTHETDMLFMYVFWVMAISFIILMALMFLFMFKYRRRPGTTALRSASHNTPLELTWSVVPLLLMIPMFFYGFHGYLRAVVAPGDAEEILLTARKWSWAFTYPNGAQSPELTQKWTKISPVEPHPDVGPFGDKAKPEDGPVAGNASPIFVAPAGRPIRLRMSSADVIHSFWIPDFRTKFDVFPNRYTSYWFQANEDQIGDHIIQCAEYCGDLHSEMSGVLRVVSEADYQQIVEKWGDNILDPPVIRGGKLSKAKGCMACHSIDGSRNVGPSWKNMFGYPVQFTNGTAYTAQQMADPTFFANYAAESMLDPSKLIVDGYAGASAMPSFAGQLKDDQREALIAYIKSLSDKAPAAAAAGEPGSAPTPAPGAINPTLPDAKTSPPTTVPPATGDKKPASPK